MISDMEIMFQEKRSCRCALQKDYSETFHKSQWKAPVPASHFSKVASAFEEDLWATASNNNLRIHLQSNMKISKII